MNVANEKVGAEESFETEAGDVVVVPPESWRQLAAVERSKVFVVGPPNVRDDGVPEDDENEA